LKRRKDEELEPAVADVDSVRVAAATKLPRANKMTKGLEIWGA
jgi:hypothetical protein